MFADLTYSEQIQFNPIQANQQRCRSTSVPNASTLQNVIEHAGKQFHWITTQK
jgi:hypothetical protein